MTEPITRMEIMAIPGNEATYTGGAESLDEIERLRREVQRLTQYAAALERQLAELNRALD